MSAPSGGDDRLESWKEIAAYLGREVRTVQLWEKSENLPVHRHQHARQGSVYAFKTELDAWRDARKNSPVPVPAASSKPRAPWIVAGAIAVLVIGGLAVWKGRRPVGDLPSAVVVLPFLDLSPEKDSEYFSDGLTEEVIDALSRVPNLRVVARTSAFAFKGKNTDIREIGKQLNVNAVIEGSVRKSGDRLRITAQLNRVSDGYHMWSRTYDRELRDVFAVQREISQSIASELRAGQLPTREHREPTKDLEAYRLYQEGRYFFNKFEPPESDYKAIERYQQAIARDPNFAAAYAGMADAYSYLAENFVVAPRQVMPKAKEAAMKALALDDSSAEAHTSLGIVKLDYERDREGSQREFLRALQLNPAFGWARHWYAHSLESQNRMEDALREMRAALDMDPLSAPISWDIAGELISLRRYDEALDYLKKATELFPGVPTFAIMRVCAYYRKGDVAAARSLVESLKQQPELRKDPMFIAVFATQAAIDGQSAEARQTLARFEEMRKTQYIEPFLLIELCNALKDRKQLMIWLRRADEERSTFVVYMHAYAAYWGLDSETLAEFDKLPQTRALTTASGRSSAP
ncbi:MAG TPA: tetratricopeptide repeat protein [Bryobacteraceae bacterium]|nr:tetratricopeptide repeat protein [Bryobacteraceae bacterium]